MCNRIGQQGKSISHHFQPRKNNWNLLFLSIASKYVI